MQIDVLLSPELTTFVLLLLLAERSELGFEFLKELQPVVVASWAVLLRDY